jgi:hypothetical protein
VNMLASNGKAIVVETDVVGLLISGTVKKLFWIFDHAVGNPMAEGLDLFLYVVEKGR